ncbi:hypothetical protein AB1Y20_008686 [Prymnesium parvum]|uniref:Fe2OG dioxygenase domain-containing protein n=1 Tax=Prymnesium parvum TaxID=97485 RepID=A0AB34IT32_PRYPA
MLQWLPFTPFAFPCPKRCAGSPQPAVLTDTPSLGGDDLPLQPDWRPQPLAQLGNNTFIVRELLTRSESEAIIAAAEGSGAFSPERIDFGWGRVSTRDVARFEDPSLSHVLSQRLQMVLPDLIGRNATSSQEKVWRPSGLNSVLRIARYRPGDQLPLHNDHVTFAGRCRSAWTLTIYLNSLLPSEGGRIVFPPASQEAWLARSLGLREEPNMFVEAVQPAAGAGLLLAHDVLHAALSPSTRTKFILRTEPLYWSSKATTGAIPMWEVDMRWPSAPRLFSSRGNDEVEPGIYTSRSVCSLEQVVATERECPSCS